MLLLCVPAFSQPSGPRDGRGPRDGGPRFGRPSPRRARWPSSRPRTPKGELNRLWRDIADLEKTPNALSKAQAAQVVALVLPVSQKAALTETDAQTLSDKIEGRLKQRPKSRRREESPAPPTSPTARHRAMANGAMANGAKATGRAGERRAGERRAGPPPRDGERREGEGRGPRRGGARDGGRPDGPPRLSRERVREGAPVHGCAQPLLTRRRVTRASRSCPPSSRKMLAERYGARRALLEDLSRRAQGR